MQKAAAENRPDSGGSLSFLRNRRFASIAILAVVGVIVYLLVMRSSRAGGAVASADTAIRRAAIPVTAVAARIGDLDRYLTGLGTVTPFNTVTLKTRVDGQIMRVDFTEGQLVRAGQLLVEIDPRPFEVQLEQAQGQTAHDVAALKEAQLDLARDQVLFNSDAIASQQLDQQRTTVRQDAATVVSDRGLIDNAKLQLTYSRITAPISGRIGLRLVDPGNIVHATDTTGLAVITQLEPIAVLFSIPEDNLEQVLDAMREHTLPIIAYDREFKRKLADGSLLTLDNQIDTTTGTVKLKASFANSDHSLFPNQFVNVRLLSETLHDQVLIPQAAIQRSSLGSFVYVVKPDNQVEVHKITIGATEGDQAAVASGLASGELVVTDGVDRLQQGSLVAMQNATPAASTVLNVAQ